MTFDYITMCRPIHNYSVQIRHGNLNVTYCVSRSISMSRSFDIKSDKICEFYQAFNVCAVDGLQLL